MKKDPTPTEMVQYWKELKEQIKEDFQPFKLRFPHYSQDETILYCNKMVYSIENDIDCVLSKAFEGNAKILAKEMDGKKWAYTKIINL